MGFNDNSDSPQRITPASSPLKIKDRTNGDSSNNYTTYGSSKSNDDGDDKDDPIVKLIQQYSPQLSQLSFGGVMGFCSGLSLKKLGKAAAYVIGLGFLGAQALQHFGYIRIDYGRIQKHINKVTDVDGDGKLTSNDIVYVWKEFKKVVTKNLPSSGGFSMGFLFGMYSA